MIHKFLALSLVCCAFQQVAFAKCDVKLVPEKLRDAFSSFQKSETLVLSEPLPEHFANPEEEFIFRNKTKIWEGYSWNIKTSEINTVIAAQERYWVLCNAFSSPVIDELINDYRGDKIGETEKSKALMMLLSLAPCLEGDAKESIDSLSAKEFVKDTSGFFDLLLISEAETPRYLEEYKACGAAEKETAFIVTDNFFKGLETFSKEFGLEKNFPLRVKQLRKIKTNSVATTYVFKKLDTLFGI